MSIRHEFTAAEVNEAFERLERAIGLWTLNQQAAGAARPWRDYNGDPIDPPLATDFYLMSEERTPAATTLAFKHADTRNYVYLTSEGRLCVPVGDRPFHRGYF